MFVKQAELADAHAKQSQCQVLRLLTVLSESRCAPMITAVDIYPRLGVAKSSCWRA